MNPERLEILCLSPMPPSPPHFGAQARMHGLFSNLARRHRLTAVSLVGEEFDADACRRAMREYCSEVVLVPNPKARNGAAKRVLQLCSLASPRSFERHLYSLTRFQEAVDAATARRRFDVVQVEFPYFGHYRLRKAPAGARPPLLILDAHEIAHDVVRQSARSGEALRRVYAAVDWRKLRREELGAFRSADGICTCSSADEKRVLNDVPSARTLVVPNAADVDHYQPRPGDPPADGRTVVFFGLLSTFQNLDGVLYLVKEIWPLIEARRPDARLKIIGARPPREVLELAGPKVEITGLVDDLRPHLASAGALVVPLRIGGGTRLKIVEGMAMQKGIVSTSLGAEGIDAVPGRDILIADDPQGFAAAVVSLLDDPGLAARLGRAGRKLATERYAWSAAARRLEGFCQDLLEARSAG
jgi:polysaccharide biosynthesis protein PslH